jgi:hypothetical protein
MKFCLQARLHPAISYDDRVPGNFGVWHLVGRGFRGGSGSPTKRVFRGDAVKSNINMLIGPWLLGWSLGFGFGGVGLVRSGTISTP